MDYLDILYLPFPRGSKRESQLLPPSLQSLYYYKIFMCTQRDYIQNGMWNGEGRRTFPSQQKRPQVGAVPYLTGLRTPYHLGHFPGPFILFCTPNLLLSNYLSLFPVALKIVPETPHLSYFSHKLASKVLGTDSLILLAKIKDPPGQDSTLQKRQYGF